MVSYSIPTRIHGTTVHSIRAYGAKGDGVADDTASFQQAIDSLPSEGGVIVVEPGQYLINPIVSVRTRSKLRVEFHDGAVLIAKANAEPRTNVILIDGDEDVEIINPQIVGDREGHTYVDTGNSTRTHEWGHGIRVTKSARVTITGGLIKDCTGDGMSVAGTDIFLSDITSTNNRRQGLTIGRGETIQVYNCELSDTNGTAPEAGIDIEPDAPGETRNVVVEGCRMLNNAGPGLEVYTRLATETVPAAVVDGVRVRYNVMEGNGHGMYTVRCSTLDIFGNEFKGNKYTGLRLSVGTRDVYVAENISGGNYTKNGAIDRPDFVQFGWTKSVERDILMTSSDTENVSTIKIGRNYFR